MKKAQYFSADIIIAIIIFIFSLSLLFNYWNGLKSENQQKKDFLYYEAFRISEIFLGVGDYYTDRSNPNSLSPWYSNAINANRAIRAGFGSLDNLSNKIIYSTGQAGSLPDIRTLKAYTSESDVNYIAMKSLIGTSLNFYVVFELYDLNTLTSNNLSIAKYEFGLKPGSNNFVDIIKVRRIVYASNPVNKKYQFIGIMDVYVWDKQNR